MSYSGKEVLESGELVGINVKPKCGHFYFMPDKCIYRAAMGDADWTILTPICTQAQLDKLVEKGRVVLPDSNTHLCEQCGKDIGMEYLLGAVCKRCCQLNHRKVCGLC